MEESVFSLLSADGSALLMSLFSADGSALLISWTSSGTSSVEESAFS